MLPARRQNLRNLEESYVALFTVWWGLKAGLTERPGLLFLKLLLRGGSGGWDGGSVGEPAPRGEKQAVLENWHTSDHRAR